MIMAFLSLVFTLISCSPVSDEARFAGLWTTTKFCRFVNWVESGRIVYPWSNSATFEVSEELMPWSAQALKVETLVFLFTEKTGAEVCVIFKIKIGTCGRSVVFNCPFLCVQFTIRTIGKVSRKDTFLNISETTNISLFIPFFIHVGRQH